LRWRILSCTISEREYALVGSILAGTWSSQGREGGDRDCKRILLRDRSGKRPESVTEK
jgi:hypothetical protein